MAELDFKAEDIDIVEAAWQNAAARERPCPAPALVQLAALRGPLLVDEDVRSHLLGERCLICEAEVIRAWRRSFPRDEVLVRAESWPVNSVLGSVLTEFVPDWQAQVNISREAESAKKSAHVDLREVAREKFQRVEAALVGLFEGREAAPAFLGAEEAAVGPAREDVRDFGDYIQMRVPAHDAETDSVEVELAVSFFGLELAGSSAVEFILLDSESGDELARARVEKPTNSQLPIPLSIPAVALTRKLQLAVGVVGE